MASNSFGELLRMTTFGESHGPAVGVVVDGVPPGLPLAVEDFLGPLSRRRPGQSAVTTSRQESDEPELLSGVFEGATTGAPVAAIVRNRDARPKDYEHLRDQARPGHADETYQSKYGRRDHRGGGRSSGRETIARVLAGVVARPILPAETRVIAHAAQIGPHVAKTFDPDVIESNPVRCADIDAARDMEAYVLRVKEENDSTGGLVECRVLAPPANLGEPTFAKLKARLADALLSIGAVTGFEYGAGFEAANLRGRTYVSDRAHFGGILGGISTGEPLIVRVGVKPTTSLGDVAAKGRHDPCIVPRVIPVIEAMVTFVLADLTLAQRANTGSDSTS